MIKLAEMDEHVTFAAQLEDEEEKEGRGRSVILINKINVKPEDVDEVLKAWAEDAAFFKNKPGFISAQLHRGIGGSGVFINYAVWESVGQLKQARSRVWICPCTLSGQQCGVTAPLSKSRCVSNMRCGLTCKDTHKVKNRKGPWRGKSSYFT